MPSGKKLYFSNEEIDFFTQTRHLTCQQLLELFEQKFKRTLNKNGLCKWLNKHGYSRTHNVTGQFKKNQAPWNKGLKGYKPSPETLWKKGHRCWWRAKSIGTERLNKEGQIEVKISMTKEEGKRSRTMWRLRSHFVWEQHTGELIPKGMVILHLNSQPDDDRIENLALISRRENFALQKHGYHQLPQDPELRKTMRLMVQFDIKRREFDEKHGLYKKYVNPRKKKALQPDRKADTGMQANNESCESN